MKLILTTSALALILAAGSASAQSVLERVMSQVDGVTISPINGTFANIAENVAILGGGTQTVYTPNGGGAPLSAEQAQSAYDTAVQDAYDAAYAGATPVYADPDGDGNLGAVWFYPDANGDYVPGAPTYASEADAKNAIADEAVAELGTFQEWLVAGYEPFTIDLGPQAILNSIDGSIENTMSGISTSTANVGTTVTALDQVTVDLGDMATTVLGAVNTGDITLGTNQDVSEAIAGTSSAVSAKINQLGGAGDTGALVLNVAHNATNVIGSVKNTFSALNGSVGDVSTTVLGAVNTGTITSGVNAAVNGVKAGVIGGS